MVPDFTGAEEHCASFLKELPFVHSFWTPRIFCVDLHPVGQFEVHNELNFRIRYRLFWRRVIKMNEIFCH
jgi:hypothetical protein